VLPHALWDGQASRRVQDLGRARRSYRHRGRMHSIALARQLPFRGGGTWEAGPADREGRDPTTGEGLAIRVKVLDVRQAYGRDDILVTPIHGERRGLGIGGSGEVREIALRAEGCRIDELALRSMRDGGRRPARRRVWVNRRRRTYG
jgi:hypothetical protein